MVICIIASALPLWQNIGLAKIKQLLCTYKNSRAYSLSPSILAMVVFTIQLIWFVPCPTSRIADLNLFYLGNTEHTNTDHCKADLLFNWFGVGWFIINKQSLHLAGWSAPNQSNRRSTVQWSFLLSVLQLIVFSPYFLAFGFNPRSSLKNILLSPLPTNPNRSFTTFVMQLTRRSILYIGHRSNRRTNIIYIVILHLNIVLMT